MKAAPAALLLGFLAMLPPVPAPQPTAGAGGAAIERVFHPGGSVGLDLSAGGYIIRGIPDDAIRVRWRTRSPGDAARAHVEVVVEGTTANVRTRGPKDGFTVEIDLPARSDIHLSLSAGDLKVRGLEGSKRVSVWAGDVLLEVGDPDQYGKVEASVRMGDLTMQPFGIGNTGGIFRSRSWAGKGRYTINAKLFAGDLKLVR